MADISVSVDVLPCVDVGAELTVQASTDTTT